MAQTTIRQDRKALQQGGSKVPRYISLERFKRAWIRYFGPPVLPSDKLFLDSGLRLFWEDYLTGEPQPVTAYLAGVDTG